MAAFAKYDTTVEKLAEGVFNLATDSLSVRLSNTAPTQATDSTTADITEIATGNGYTQGTGIAVTQTTSAQTSGLYKLVCADPASLTASGGSIGPFRYVILVENTGGNLLGYWDYGTNLTLADGESFSVDFDQVNGVIQLS
jgi:hypothetical protein